MDTKECKEKSGGCGKILPVSEFCPKWARGKEYFDTLCKKCRSIKNKEYEIKNKEHIVRRRKAFYNRNKDRLNKNRLQYRLDHIEEDTKYKLKYNENRYKTDPLYKLKILTSCSVRQALKDINFKKSKRTVKYLDCDIIFLRNYLEFQFRDGMNWDNQGKNWHIDHIIPLAYFNLSDIEEQKKAFHYSNLQPLPKKENLSKNDKIFPQILYRLWNGEKWIDFREIKLLPKP